MILSNSDILAAIEAQRITIDPLTSKDVSGPPFNASSLDLRLAATISVPKACPINLRLDQKYDRDFYARNSQREEITDARPYVLKPRCFILAQTIERVALPMTGDGPFYAARIEGRSSLARYGMLVHFTAPTIHAGFSGPITLEIINLGPNDISLTPSVYVCQLIFERLTGRPGDAPNQFRDQTGPEG